jgi:RNA polymerase sigma-32 factor
MADNLVIISNNFSFPKVNEDSTIKTVVNAKSEREQVAEYIKKVNSFPVLTEEQEKALLIDFFKNQNPYSGHHILNSHLRLVVKIAMQYRKFHSSMLDLIAEGNLGLLKALKNFSLKKEVRFSTYAILWVKASIQNFLTKSITSIKAITTSSQKKLLFGLNKAKRELGIVDGMETSQDKSKLSKMLGINEKEIAKYERMMFEIRQISTNEPINGEEGVIGERGDFVSNGEMLEDKIIQKSNNDILKKKIQIALSKLSLRESDIVKYRILNPEKYTLAELSTKFNISKERIRQIQENALKKLRDILKDEKHLINFS